MDCLEEDFGVGGFSSFTAVRFKLKSNRRTNAMPTRAGEIGRPTPPTVGIAQRRGRMRPMSTIELRHEAKALIDEMSPAQLRVASEFLAFVKQREANAATLELLALPGFEKSFERGVKDIKAGRVKPWRQVRPRV